MKKTETRIKMVPKTKRYYLVLIATLPADLFAWSVVLFVWALWGHKLHFLGLVLQTEFKPDSWPMRTWYKNWGGSNFGHGAIYRPGRTGGDGMDTRTEVHEHFHGEQVEASMVFTQLIGLYAYFVIGAHWGHCLALWCSGIFVPYLCASFVAWVRGEEFYRGNVNEEGAYAYDDKEPPDVLK